MKRISRGERFIDGCAGLVWGLIALGSVFACCKSLNLVYNKTKTYDQKKISRAERFVMTLPEVGENGWEPRLNALAREWHRAEDVGDRAYAADLLRELRKEQAQSNSNTWREVEEKMRDLQVISPIVLMPSTAHAHEINSSSR